MATALRSVFSEARSSAIPQGVVRPSAAAVWAIGRIEARKMLLHPSFLVGIAFGLFMLRGASGSGGTQMTLLKNAQWVVLGLLAGSVIGTVLAANVATVRPRRSGVQELFGSLPAPAETLTGGVFTGLLIGPGVLAAVLTGLGWLAFRSDPDIAPHLNVFLAVQFPLTVTALGTIGIGIGRWIPNLFGGPIVIILHVFTPLIWAIPWIVPSSDVGSAPWHIVYPLAVITTWLALAFARDRRTLWRFAVVLGACAIGVAAAFQQVPEGGW